MRFANAAERLAIAARPAQSGDRRNLLGACLAHLLHDGCTDLLYVLLPIWRVEFGLSYAGLAVLRALYYGTMGGLQVPGARLVAPFGARGALVLATVTAAAGYLVMALPGGFAGLCAGLILAGIGSSLQHPCASQLVTSTYGPASRGPLGIYNFAGDLGKSIFPAIVAVLLPLLAWRSVAGLVAVTGVAVAGGLLWLVPSGSATAQPTAKPATSGTQGAGFRLLLVIGALDTAPRMGFLLFLPFLLQSKGASQATIGIGLAALFVGGALGKAACGWLGQHLGVVWSVIATETATALLIAAALAVPLGPIFVLLPVLGIVLNGTSSVLYGTVPELAPNGDTARAFALFYTGVIGSGGLSPIGYGFIADHSTQGIATLTAALTALAIVPLVLALRPALKG